MRQKCTLSMIKILRIFNLNLKEKNKKPQCNSLTYSPLLQKKKKNKTPIFPVPQITQLLFRLPFRQPHSRCVGNPCPLCVCATDAQRLTLHLPPNPRLQHLLPGVQREPQDRLLPSPPRPVLQGAARGILPTLKSSPALPSHCPRPLEVKVARGRHSLHCPSCSLPPGTLAALCRGFAPAVPTARMLLPSLLQGGGPLCSSMRASLATLFLHTHTHLLPDPHLALSCSPFLRGTYCKPIRWIFNSPPWSRKFHKGHGFACCPPTPRTRCQAPRRRSRTVC